MHGSLVAVQPTQPYSPHCNYSCSRVSVSPRESREKGLRTRPPTFVTLSTMNRRARTLAHMSLSHPFSSGFPLADFYGTRCSFDIPPTFDCALFSSTLAKYRPPQTLLKRTHRGIFHIWKSLRFSLTALHI